MKRDVRLKAVFFQKKRLLPVGHFSSFSGIGGTLRLQYIEMTPELITFNLKLLFELSFLLQMELEVNLDQKMNGKKVQKPPIVHLIALICWLKVLENDKERNKKNQDRRFLPKRDFKDYISRWPKTSSFYNNIKLVTQYTDCPRVFLSMPQWLLLGISVHKVFERNLNFRYQRVKMKLFCKSIKFKNDSRLQKAVDHNT